MAAQNVIREPGDGTSIKVMGVEIVFKVVSADTDGQYACYEYTAPPGFNGPPPHRHQTFDETFFILEGVLTLSLNEQTIHAQPGTFVQVAKGTAHSFANHGRMPTRFLVLVIPGGLERYFEELPDLIDRHGYPPPPEVMAELGRKYDTLPITPPDANKGIAPAD